MYKLSPRNKYILLEERKVAEQKRSFVLPTSFKEDISYHKIMKVVEDSSGNYGQETLLLVPSNAIEEINIEGNKYYLTSENYVMAIVTQSED